jgi:hypothetical protein
MRGLKPNKEKGNQEKAKTVSLLGVLRSWTPDLAAGFRGEPASLSSPTNQSDLPAGIVTICCREGNARQRPKLAFCWK